jgi:hypothetical protein
MGALLREKLDDIHRSARDFARATVLQMIIAP